MSVKIAEFHRMSKRGETSKFDQNPRPRGAAKARTTSFKFSRSAKRGYGESFKFSRATKHELAQTAHLKSTPKGRAPYAAKSRCNEARCENTPPKHTQRIQKNLPKRCELRAIKILPQRRAEDTVKFRYKDRCGELKRYAHQAVNFINLAEQSLGYEFKFSRAMNRVAAQAKCARQGATMNFKFNDAASYKFNQTVRHMVASKQHIWRFAKIPSQCCAWQTAEILPQQYARQKIEISRAANHKNSAAIRQAASRRNFIEIARLMRHQISAENNKIIAESCKILIERHKIPAERGAAR